jgi:hypothetical protein
LLKIADLEDVNYKDIKDRVINALKNYHGTIVSINIIENHLKFLENMTLYDMSYLDRTKEEIKSEISVFSEELRIKKSVISMISKLSSSKELSKNEKFLIWYCYIDKDFNQDTFDTILKKFNKKNKKNYTFDNMIRIRDRALNYIINQIIADDEAREIFKRGV